MSKYFIIKADDLHLNRIQGGWKYFLPILNENFVRADLGVIGKSVIAEFPFRELILRNELFLHGYLHEIKEYQKSPLSRQIELIAKTKSEIQQHLGILVDIFGAPGNNINKDTMTALRKNDIKVWFFGYDDPQGEIVNLKNKLRFEFSDNNRDRFRQQRVNGHLLTKKLFNGIRMFEREWVNLRIPDNCGYEELVERYQKLEDKSLIIGQIHPHQWSRKDLSQFIKFIDFVRNKEKRKVVTAGDYVTTYQESQFCK